MNNLSAFTPLALTLLLALAAPAADAASVAQAPAAGGGPSLRRFALIASTNDGGPGRPRLRYADSDARAVADVLRSLGGLRGEDTVILPSVTRTSLQKGLGRMKEALALAGGGGARRELFVYYSGHSNEEGLLLGHERFEYEELRRFINDADAEVRIAILDSCASGALIRQRGGSKRASFLHDASIAARGHAFLTASAADEAAQESDRVGGAFFTHYLLSGLRGAADTSRDGRVTLGEAYQFAYQETLFRTERTVGGPQHANYDIQMAGTGDLLVMTDLRATGAGLLIDESVAGRLYVRDASGRLLVELRKEPLYPVELGLGPGSYRIFLDADGRPFEATVTLENGKTARLGRTQFRAATPLVASSRGQASEVSIGPASAAELSAAAPTLRRTYRHVPFELMIAPPLRTGGRADEQVLNNFVLGAVAHSHALRGMQLSLGANTVEHDQYGMQVTVGANRVGESAHGLQVAVGANTVGGDYWGLQVGAGFNGVEGSLHGLQVAAGANRARGSAHGMQVAAGMNRTQASMHGLQVAGFANLTTTNLHGMQVGVGNYTGGNATGAQVGVVSYLGGDLRGLQVSPGAWVDGTITGLQVGVLTHHRGLRGAQVGVANLARGPLQGLQVAVLNVGGAVSGAQIGVINIASRVDGPQIGVINVAGSSAAPIGVFNFIRDGYYRLQLWSSDLTPTNIGIKMGGRHVYTQLGFGLGKSWDDRTLMNAQGAIGVHLLVNDRLFVDFDLGTAAVGTTSRWSQDGTLNTARLVVGYQLARHLAIIGGPTFNVHVHDREEREQPGMGWLERSIEAGSQQVRLFPGFVIGLQI
jgi:hypothetical protein